MMDMHAAASAISASCDFSAVTIKYSSWVVGVEAIDADCNAVYGAEIGDSCDTVTEKFGLSLDEFLAINVSCNFFEGQWLCVDGSPNN
ncbi:hypothetical protein ACLB2K_051376 [Fragaria x ananassa]